MVAAKRRSKSAIAPGSRCRPGRGKNELGRSIGALPSFGAEPGWQSRVGNKSVVNDDRVCGRASAAQSRTLVALMEHGEVAGPGCFPPFERPGAPIQERS